MKEVLLVGAGGFVGCVLRFRVSAFALQRWPHDFPAGTVIVNLLGCLLIGLIAGALERRQWLSPEIRLLLITGFLGGFTTFSAFGYETVSLLRRGSFLVAAANIGVSILGGLLMVAIGLKAGAALPPPGRAPAELPGQVQAQAPTRPPTRSPGQAAAPPAAGVR